MGRRLSYIVGGILLLALAAGIVRQTGADCCSTHARLNGGATGSRPLGATDTGKPARQSSGTLPGEALSPPVMEAQGPASDPDQTRRKHKVVAYYFHRTPRCLTCLAIEEYTQKAIRGEFADYLADGSLELRITNLDEPDQAHFEREFDLDRQSVILAELNGNRVQRWDNLTRIWDLVEDELAFEQYIVDEVWRYLQDVRAPVDEGIAQPAEDKRP